jgi:choline-glycine betaine transporter
MAHWAAILLGACGLKRLQIGAILAAFPFVFVIIISLLKSFQEETGK